MLTTEEFAQKCGCTRQTVGNWIRKGYIKGAIYVKPPGERGMYMIPDDARKPRVTSGPYPLGKWVQVVKPKMRLADAYIYLRRHALTKTYRQISDETGYPVLVLRQMYDKLHELYCC